MGQTNFEELLDTIRRLHFSISERDDYIRDSCEKIHKAFKIFRAYYPAKNVPDPEGMYNSITGVLRHLEVYLKKGKECIAKLDVLANNGLKLYYNTSALIDGKMYSGIFLPIPYIPETKKQHIATQTIEYGPLEEVKAVNHGVVLRKAKKSKLSQPFQQELKTIKEPSLKLPISHERIAKLVEETKRSISHELMETLPISSSSYHPTEDESDVSIVVKYPPHELALSKMSSEIRMEATSSNMNCPSDYVIDWSNENLLKCESGTYASAILKEFSRASFKSIDDIGGMGTSTEAGTSQNVQMVDKCSRIDSSSASGIDENANLIRPSTNVQNSLDAFQVSMSKSMERIKSSFSVENLIGNTTSLPIARKSSSLQVLKVCHSSPTETKVCARQSVSSINVGSSTHKNTSEAEGTTPDEKPSSEFDFDGVLYWHSSREEFAPGAKFYQFDSEEDKSTTSAFLQNDVDNLKDELGSPNPSKPSMCTPFSTTFARKFRPGAAELLGLAHASRFSLHEIHSREAVSFQPELSLFRDIQQPPEIIPVPSKNTEEGPVNTENDFVQPSDPEPMSTPKETLRPKTAGKKVVWDSKINKEVKLNVTSHIVKPLAKIPKVSKNYPYTVKKKRSKSLFLSNGFPRTNQNARSPSTPPRRHSTSRCQPTSDIFGWENSSSVTRFQTEYRTAFRVPVKKKSNEEKAAGASSQPSDAPTFMR